MIRVSIIATRVILCCALGLLLSCSGSTASAVRQGTDGEVQQYINAVIIKVEDGDTCTIRDAAGSEFRMRFWGVDTPEHESKGKWQEQPYAKEAHEFTRRLLPDGEQVMVKLKMVMKNGKPTPDMTFGRYVGEVFVDGRSVNRELAREGYAWHFAKFAPDDHDLKQLFERARQEKRGLFVDPKAVPPWTWRGDQ